MSAAWWGIVLIGGGGGLLVLWLSYALWEHRRRGERSGAISRVGVGLLSDNVGKRRRDQVRGVVLIAVGVAVVVLVLLFMVWAEGRDWFAWQR